VNTPLNRPEDFDATLVHLKEKVKAIQQDLGLQ
jgi:hypothetical protein